jgi:hypothetical protein
MGLTIHYSGMLRNPADRTALIAEAIDISESMKWPYQHLPSHPDVPIEGVLISPEGSEPLWLTFHDQGFLCNPLLFQYVRNVEGKDIPADAEQWLFTKTQYAGVEAHMAMVRFMRYLSETYFERFEMIDESNYWETQDESICRQKFGDYDRVIGMVGDALDQMEFDPNETQEEIGKRVAEMLGKQFGFEVKTIRVDDDLDN